MKKTSFNDIKKMDTKALLEKAKSTKKEIVEKYMDKNMAKLKNLKEIKNKRRDLAQMLTVLRQKQLLKELEVNDAEK